MNNHYLKLLPVEILGVAHYLGEYNVLRHGYISAVYRKSLVMHNDISVVSTAYVHKKERVAFLIGYDIKSDIPCCACKLTEICAGAYRCITVSLRSAVVLCALCLELEALYVIGIKLGLEGFVYAVLTISPFRLAKGGGGNRSNNLLRVSVCLGNNGKNYFLEITAKLTVRGHSAL